MLQRSPRHAELAPLSSMGWGGRRAGLSLSGEERGAIFPQPSGAQGFLSTFHWTPSLCTRCSQLSAEGTESTLTWEGPQKMGTPSRDMGGKGGALRTYWWLPSLSLAVLSYQTELVMSSLRERKRDR